MNKEINITFPGQILDYVDTKEHLLELFNHITNLQENEDLKGIAELRKDTLIMNQKKIDKVIDNCEKSIESINKKLTINNEPIVIDGVLHNLNDYQVCRLKAIRMKCKEILNILQGEDKDENKND